ncbi:MAG TPA: amino acid adenylation domain-containing protein [Longimicrobiaceae bacterium]|nr:amino acid adenylation domain-containing protein [Longimicrobiaceae bacterium]
MSENNTGSREAALAAARQALLRKRIQGVGAATAAPRAIPRRPDPERAPLSFAQQRLWFIDQLSPGNPSYNIPFPVRIHGKLNTAALERALGEVVRRQEALRTVIATDDAGNPVQRILPPPVFHLPVTDVAGDPEEEREAAMLRRVAAEARHPFDLATGPLFRAELFRLADEDHLLTLTFHHVVGDGFSTHLLMREIPALYDAFSRGLPSPLPELRAQYGDFAVWQRNRLQGAAFEKQVAFWTEKLRGAPPLLDLPADHPRPPVHGHRSGTVPLSVSAETTDRLRALAREEGTTLFSVVLAALSAHLGRYAHQEEVVVGVPVDNRGLPELEEIVGVFLNTLPIRTPLGGDPTFRETVARVRTETAAAFAHQDVQFEKLVDELKIERNLSYPPVFQVMFTFNDTGGHPGAPQDAAVPATRFRPLHADPGNVSFDLVLVAGAGPSGVLGGWKYSAELFGEATAARMAREFERLLERVAADPGAPLSTLSVLEGAERDRVLAEWNRTARDYPPSAGLHGLVRRWAERTPEATALVSGQERVTYAELDRRAGRLARLLATRGVGPETRVGICTARDTGMVVAILAVLRAGGAYVPIDPAYPAERIAFLLRDSAVPLLLTSTAVRDALPPFAGQTLLVEGEGGGEGAGAPLPVPDPESAAYLIYTSGSTGAPKGVVVPHRAACNLLHDAVERFGIGPGNRAVHTASLGFDASVLEIFLPLAAGAELHLVDRETVRSGDELASLLREREVDVWVSTPVLLEAVAGEELPAVRVVSSGGDRLGGETARRWSEGRRLLNLYGPTETTVFSAAHECAPGSADAPPLGRPAANTRIYLVDTELRPVVPGVPGEILIGGAGLARGYLGRPELTAERFLPDLFSGEPGARVYRTGDLGRLRPDGELEFRGRVDEQVKVRGFRIEPGEIEAALLALGGIREAAVVARDDAPGGPRLVAYLVPDDPGALPEDPRPALRRRLPEHLVPSVYVPLPELPRTPSGKLDRRALPAPDARLATQREYVAPRTALETVLAGVWAEVLGRERVGIADNFFDLGGHSLLATQVSTRLRTSKIPVPVRMLFQHPTLEELARAIVAAEPRPGQTEKVASLILKVQSLSPDARQQLLRRGAPAAAEVGG